MSKIDLYAPYERENDSTLHGAAAMNKRLSEMGGANGFGAAMLETGFKLGIQAAIAKSKKGKK